MEWPEAKLARLVKVLGAISQDGLSISGVPIAEITRRVSTPCYVYSGEAIIAHNEKCERYSAALMPPFPTSSISASFQCPGPA